MKIKHLLAALALSTTATMLGGPAYPGEIIRTQPDGSTISVRLYGDEFFNYMTDSEGRLLCQDAQGHVVPMLRNGVQLTADSPTIAMLRSEQEAMLPDLASTLGAPERMAALDSEGRTTFPTTAGDVHSLVILMEFSDKKFTTEEPVTEFTNWLNQEGYSNHDAVGSVKDYYMAVSENQFKPQFDVYGVVPLPETSAYYVGTGRYEKIKEALTYAVNYMDDKIDFSKYDFDEDGIIDTIYFIYAGYGQADTGDETTIWPHQSSMKYSNITLDGLKFEPYATSNELKGGTHYYNKDNMLSGIGTFCHEFGHVLGLPDLYDIYTDRNGQNAVTPGTWSIMDQGSYNNDGTCPPLFSAYEKWLCKWIEYEEPEAGKHYEMLSSDQKSRGIRLSIYRPNGSVYSPEYFVLESRSKTGWDAHLEDEGLLIWHIDYSANIWKGNTVNSTVGHPRVFLVSADGTANPFLDTTGSPKYAAWPGEANRNPRHCIFPNNDISFDLYFSAMPELDVYLTDIQYDTEQRMSSFDYNAITEQPTDMTVLHPAIRTIIDNNDRNIRLEWDPVEGATGYALTVWRVNSSGKTFYLNNINETNVGNVTNYEFKSISDALFKQTYYAYVRVIKGVPSSEKSNEITFTPTEMEAAGVEGIYDVTSPVYGINGKVVAPEGAEIYNLSGLKVANHDLPAGMYIVRVGAKTSKVIVK